MASLLETLGVTGLQYNSLQVLYNQGYSASGAISFLQGTPAAIRKTTGLAVFRALGAADIAAKYVQSIPGYIIPNPANLSTSITSQKREYSYKFRLGVIDRNTGETSIVYRNLSSNDLVSAGVALDALQELMSNTQSTSGVDFQDAQLENITVNGGE